MTLHLIQGSDEWLRARLGRVTSSRVYDATKRTQKGWGAIRETYLCQIVAERLTGKIQPVFVTDAMRWGKKNEEHARRLYEFRSDADIRLVGLMPHPRIEEGAASPDGLIGDDGHVEFKCPNSTTHITTIIKDEVPEEYLAQMQWQMACSGRSWCDYVSYDPRLPEEIKLYVRRVNRDAAFIEKMEADVEIFLRDVEKTIEQLAERCMARDPLVAQAA